MSTVALWLKRGFIGARSFTPGRLFAANEQGAWYDPSDFSTLFQDSAGTTPVTAVEQPVGLMLDKSRGPVLSSDLVTNGDFASATGWTLAPGSGGSATISGGLLTLSGGSASFPSCEQSGILTAGRWYSVTVVTTTPITAGSLGVRIGGVANNFPNITTAGTYTATILADGTIFRLIRNSGFTDTVTIDSVTIRDIPSNYDFQTSRALGPELAPVVSSLTAASIDNFGGAVSTFSGGVWSITTASTEPGYPRLRVSVPGIVVGRRYLITFSATWTGTVSGLYVRLSTGGSSNDVGTLSASGGSLTARQVAASADQFEIVAAAGTTTGTITITSLSVREIPGNHAFQATAASRPTLRAKYNLFERTEEFDNAWWTKNNAGITANATAAPDGTTTADAHVSTNGTLNREISRSGFPVVSGEVYTFSIYLKYDASGAAPWVELTTVTGIAKRTWVNTQTGAIGVMGHTSATATDAGNGWWRFAIKYTAGGTSEQFYISSRSANGDAGVTTANGTAIQFYVWGAQLLTAADQTATGGAYQRVGAATDYATGGLFRPYLAFDGVDDNMATNSVDFTTVTSDGLPRRNLFSNPTQLDDAAAWPKLNALVTGNATTAPDGTTAADTFSNLAAGGVGYHYVYQAPTLLQNGTYTISAWVKHKTGSGWIWLLGETSSDAFCYFNVLTGVVGQTTGFANVTIQSAGNGWYRCSATFTKTTATTTEQIAIGLSQANSIPNWDSTGLANTQEVFVWGMQLETGSTLTGFQNIGTDRMSVFAGMHKASDAARGLLLELGPGGDGRIIIQAPDGPGSNLVTYTARGTIDVGAASPAAAPSTRVFTGLNDISADSVRLRLNGAQVDQNSSDMGVGNHANGALNIGNRQGGTLFFNGRLYALAVLGRTATPAEIAATEAWVNSKTGAY